MDTLVHGQSIERAGEVETAFPPSDDSRLEKPLYGVPVRTLAILSETGSQIEVEDSFKTRLTMLRDYLKEHLDDIEMSRYVDMIEISFENMSKQAQTRIKWTLNEQRLPSEWRKTAQEVVYLSLKNAELPNYVKHILSSITVISVIAEELRGLTDEAMSQLTERNQDLGGTVLINNDKHFTTSANAFLKQYRKLLDIIDMSTKAAIKDFGIDIPPLLLQVNEKLWDQFNNLSHIIGKQKKKSLSF